MKVMCDISSHNGPVDFARMKAAGADGVAIRVTVGSLYTDPRFYVNWDAAGAVGLPRTGYHVVRPGLPVKDQIKRFKDVVGDRRPDFKKVGWVNDCEVFDGQTKYTITSNIWGVNVELSDHAGVANMIYTRMSYWNAATTASTRWKQWALWIARYTLADAPWYPNDPSYLRPRIGEWTDWAAWQWSADGNNQGPTYGGSSTSMDLNRVKDWVFDGIGEPEPEPPVVIDNGNGYGEVVVFLPMVQAGQYKKID